MSAHTEITQVRFANGLDMDCLLLFSRAGATKEDLYRLFVQNRGKVSYLGPDCVSVSVGGDNWQVRLLDGAPALYHNDYRINEDCSRTLLSTYHRQNDGGDAGFSNLVRIMCTYSFEKHVEAVRRYERRAAAARLEGLLAITDNFTDAGWKSLLFRWYTFVDIGDRAGRHTRRFGVSSLREERRTQRGDYAVVTCRVLRFQGRRFARLMDWMKRDALREGRQDYADLCQQAIPQIA